LIRIADDDDIEEFKPIQIELLIQSPRALRRGHGSFSEATQ
jgi:hypothetical protein